jgi:anti-sigma B factor antagonist
MLHVDEPFTARTFHENGSALLVLSGELDIATAPELRAAIDAVVDGYLRVLTVDVTALVFLDVAGQRALVDAAASVAALGGRFELRGVREPVRRAIRLVGFQGLEQACPVESG